MKHEDELIHEYARAIQITIDKRTAFLVHRDRFSLFAMHAADEERRRLKRLLETVD